MDNNHLKRIFTYAYNTVPYYNIQMNELGIDVNSLRFPEDFYRMRTLTKDIIKNTGWANFINQDYLDADLNIQKNADTRIEKTSGTTQEPMPIPWSNSDYYTSIVNHWRFRQTHFGISAHSRKCDNIRNRHNDQPFFIDLIKNGMTINNFKLTYDKLAYILDTMNLFKPEWLYIQPSLLFILVRAAKETSRHFPDSIRYIEYMGEPLLHYYRQYIGNHLSVPYSNMYGCAETNGIAYECPNGNLHLLSKNVFTEILDENDSPVTEKRGKVCVTGYFNRVMPMIRYKLNDVGILHDSGYCGCGNPNPVLDLSLTRLPEFLIFDDKEICNNGAIYYPVTRFPIAKAEISDLIFTLKLINIKNYEVTFFTDFSLDKEHVQSDFKTIMSCYGLSSIDFIFKWGKQLTGKEDIGLLRVT